MSQIKNTCFISYAHEDIDRPTLEYFIHTLKDTLPPNARVLIDQDVRYGQNFNSFMELVEAVDVVLIMLTPAYRRRVLERQGGVYKEFTLIWNRYCEDREQMTDSTPNGCTSSFEIIPVRLSGDIESSTPDEIKALRQADLTGLRVIRKPTGQFVVTEQQRREYQPVLTQLAAEVYATATLDSEEYRTLTETYYDELFVELKANWNRPTSIGRDHIKMQFVETLSYRQVDRQQAFFVIGRKGSGKSTITQVLPLLHPERYDSTIKIVANHFYLEALYSLYSDPQFRSDTSTAVSRVATFEFTWEATLMLALMQRIGRGTVLKGCSDEVRQIAKPMMDFTSDLHVEGYPSLESWTSGNLFSYCFRSAVAFVGECVELARNEPQYFLTDIQVRFKRENFLQFVFGNEALASLREFLRITNKKFLVTLDEFDTAFDSFRLESIRAHDSEHLKSRAHFESDWLRSLLSLTQRARLQPDNHVYAALDFCIAAPLDRFLEVVQIERDSYRNWNRWVALKWSGIELSILLRKRLEGLAKTSTNKRRSPEGRLDEVLQHKQFKHIPSEITFEFNGDTYRMPLFMYILRHTFWRPRDLLFYYAHILALAENMQRWGNDINTDVIQKCVKSTTKYVINSEFINELRSTVVNIDDILRRFRKSANILNFDMLRETISDADFHFATGALDEQDIVSKVRFLYEVGFIGLQLTDQQQKALGLWHKHAFEFNEGPTIFGDDYLEEEDLANYTFAIHPIFSEFLRLNTHQGDLTLVFNWEYLHKAEAALIARQGS